MNPAGEVPSVPVMIAMPLAKCPRTLRNRERIECRLSVTCRAYRCHIPILRPRRNITMPLATLLRHQGPLLHQPVEVDQSAGERRGLPEEPEYRG